MPLPHDWIVPQWPAPARVRSLMTTRSGGVSLGAYASLNLGEHVSDDAQAVAQNRARLRTHLPAEPHWLRQLHGTKISEACRAAESLPQADASFTRASGMVCAVMVADCLPVLLCDRAGSVVAAAHAGWRGLSAGVLENAVAALRCRADEVLAWLGPGIGAGAFEVGDEVREAFTRVEAGAAAAFTPHAPGKWLADLTALARQRLGRVGVTQVFGGEWCTYRDAERFFSHRRDRVSGRHAALIWLES